MVKQYVSSIEKPEYGDYPPTLECLLTYSRTPDAPINQRVEIEARPLCINWDQDAVMSLTVQIKTHQKNRTARVSATISLEDLEAYIAAAKKYWAKKDTPAMREARGK